jgi:hypothetical protein
MKSFIAGLMDNFKAADFEISGKMKVKSLQKDFKGNFGVTLRVYNGVKFADPDKTLGSFKSTTTNVDGFKVKAKMTVNEVEKKFIENFGLKVQIADKNDTHLLPNSITLGEGARGEYDLKKQK